MLPFPIISNLREKSNTKVAKFIAGIGHIAALGTNGQLFTRGSNQYGQLGDISYPTDNNNWILSMENVSSIYGDRSNCLIAIKNDGTVWVCGQFNVTSQFGFVGGTGAHSWTEMTNAIPFSTTLIKDIQITFAASCIVRNDGLLYCCGTNGSGMFGNNNTNNLTLYTQSATASDVQHLYVQHGSGSATTNVLSYIDTNNHIWACGNNSVRQINSSSTSSFTAFQQMSASFVTKPNGVAIAGSTSWYINNANNVGYFCGSSATLQGGSSNLINLYSATGNNSSNITELQLASYSIVYARKTDGKFYAKEYFSGGGTALPLVNNSTNRAQWTYQHDLPVSLGVYSGMAMGNNDNAYLLFFGSDYQEIYGLGRMFPQNDSVYRILTLPSFA